MNKLTLTLTLSLSLSLSLARIAVITETWLRDGPELDDLKQDLAQGSGLGMITKNRRPCPNEVSYRGVAILWQEGQCRLKEYKIKNTEYFEVLVCAGTLKGHSRKICVMAYYLTPNLQAARARLALEYIADVVTDLKRNFTDTFIMLAGDFNQWKVGDGLADLPDLKEADVGPTRNGKKIDRIFSNVSRSITASGTLEPLD